MVTKSFNISLPKTLVDLADSAAEKEFRNRSELIREALWVYLKNKENWNELLKYGKERGRKIGIKGEEDVNRIVYEVRHGKRGHKSRS